MMAQDRALSNMPRSPQDISAMDKEVESLLKRAIKVVQEHSQDFFSHIYLVPKREGGSVINLKPLNEYI